MNRSFGKGSRALFIRFSSLGDVLLTTPAVGSFRDAFPDTEITFLTKSIYTPLLDGNPDIDRLEGLDSGGPGGGIAALAGTCRRLGTFDVVVDLHGNLRSSLCRHLVRSDVSLTYRKASVLRRLWAAGLMRSRMAGSSMHVVDRYLRTLLPLGVAPTREAPKVTLSKDEVGAAARTLSSLGATNPSETVFIFPGAKWPNKCWNSEGFAAVAASVHSDMGLLPVLAGDSNDVEAVRRVKECLDDGVPVIDLCGRTGVRELLSALSLARAAVCNDSGPGHMAAAAEVPVVSLFGPTAETFGFVPRGPRVRVVSRDLDCRPCSVHGGTACRRGRRACLDDIDPSEVTDALREITALR